MLLCNLTLFLFYFLEDILGVTSTGMEQLTSLTASTKTQEKDTFIIFIHALQNGLFRIHMQGTTGR
jgi:hypothetical protein